MERWEVVGHLYSCPNMRELEEIENVVVVFFFFLFSFLNLITTSNFWHIPFRLLSAEAFSWNKYKLLL
jgi:hypothetical protein